MLFVATRPPHVLIDWLRLGPEPDPHSLSCLAIPHASPPHRCSPLCASSCRPAGRRSAAPATCRRCRTAPAGASTSSRRRATRGRALGRNLRAGDLPPAAGRPRPGNRSGTTPRRRRSRWISCRPSRSARGARSGTARWGTAGASRPTAAGPGATGPTTSSDPEWQYVIPDGIAIRGDTTVVATADGLQITTDDGAHWTAIGDAVGPPAQRPRGHRAPAARQRVRPPAGARPPGLERRPPCAATSGCWHTAAGWQVAAAGRGRLSAGERGPDRPPAVPRHPLRPAPDHRHAALHPPHRARGRRAQGTAHRLAAPPDRAHRQRVHRPDVPLRLDDGRVLPAAPGRGVQQSRRHAGHGGAGRAGWCTPGGRRRAPTRWPSGTTPRSRPTGRPSGSTPSTITTRRSAVKVGARVQDRTGDRAGGQHRPRHQRSPSPRAGGLARPTRSARSSTRCSGFRPTPSTRSSGSSRCPDTGIVAGQVIDARRRRRCRRRGSTAWSSATRSRRRSPTRRPTATRRTAIRCTTSISP